MKLSIIVHIVACVAILLFPFVGHPYGFIQNSTHRSGEGREDCFTMPFRYVVVYNKQGSSKLRQKLVFMDPKDYSPENLKILFLHLSKDQPTTENLSILVKTDWSQLDLPSDCPGSGIEGSSLSPETNDFHRAVFYRRGGSSYFYYTKELGTEKMEKVVISKNY